MKQDCITIPKILPLKAQHLKRGKYAARASFRITRNDADRFDKLFANYNNPADPKEAGCMRTILRLGFEAAEKEELKNQEMSY